MKSWQTRIWNNIIHAAGRAFVEGACIPVLSQETMTPVLIVNQIDEAKQTKKELKK